MPIDGISGNTKIVIESKIIKVLTKSKISDSKKILSRTSFNKVGNMNNNVNGTDINKIAAARSSIRKVSIWLVLIIVIIDRRLIANARFTISSIVSIGLILNGLVQAIDVGFMDYIYILDIDFIPKSFIYILSII